MSNALFRITVCAAAVFGALPVQAQTIWDGVYSAPQADRGATFYNGVCAKCHGRSGNGAGDPDQPESPAVARTTFPSKWEGRSLAELFDYLRTAMPYDNPGSRSDQEMIDAVAHMLALSDVPAGEAELAPDVEALESIEIVAEEP